MTVANSANGHRAGSPQAASSAIGNTPRNGSPVEQIPDPLPPPDPYNTDPEDLIYLGKGLYARRSNREREAALARHERPQKQTKRSRDRILPGRVKPLPPRST